MARPKLPPDRKRLNHCVRLSPAEYDAILRRFPDLITAVRSLVHSPLLPFVPTPTVGSDETPATTQPPAKPRVAAKNPIACDTHTPVHKPSCPRCHHARWGEWPPGHKP